MQTDTEMDIGNQEPFRIDELSQNVETENVEADEAIERSQLQRQSMSFHEQSPKVTNRASQSLGKKSSLRPMELKIQHSEPQKEVPFEKTLTDVHLRINQAAPYQEVIDVLYRLKEVKQPYSAMKLIKEAKNTIPACIDEFWEGVPVDKKQLQLDADQINCIMSYVVMKAGMCDLMGQIRLIEEFTSEDQQDSEEGQAFFTLKIAAELIQNQHFDFQDILQLEAYSVRRRQGNSFASLTSSQKKVRARNQPAVPSQNPNQEAKLTFISNGSNARSQISNAASNSSGRDQRRRKLSFTLLGLDKVHHDYFGENLLEEEQVARHGKTEHVKNFSKIKDALCPSGSNSVENSPNKVSFVYNGRGRGLSGVSGGSRENDTGKNIPHETHVQSRLMIPSKHSAINDSQATIEVDPFITEISQSDCEEKI